MTYSPDEKTRIDELLNVFQPYIATSTTFDIATAPKLGYFFCTCYNAEENGIDVEFIEDADSLIQSIIDEIYYDVLFNGSGEDFDDRLAEAAKPEVTRRVSEYLTQFPQYNTQIENLVEESFKRKLENKR